MKTRVFSLLIHTPKSFRLLSRPTLGYWLAVFQFLKLAKLVENDRQEWCDENNAWKWTCSTNDLPSCKRNEREEKCFNLIEPDQLWVFNFYRKLNSKTMKKPPPTGNKHSLLNTTRKSCCIRCTFRLFLSLFLFLFLFSEKSETLIEALVILCLGSVIKQVKLVTTEKYIYTTEVTETIRQLAMQATWPWQAETV